MAVVAVTDDTFESEVINSELPVLIDFYADWCGPCKAIAPLVEAMSNEYSGSLKVVKVNVDEAPGVAQAFRIQSIPTLAVLHEKRVVDLVVGGVDRKRLDALVANVAKKPEVQNWDVQRLKLALEAGLAFPVDLRPVSDFGRARIPSAISAPIEAAAERFASMAATGKVHVFYGRTDAGVKELATAANKAGVKAGFLEGGILAWEAALLKVERPN